MLMTLILKNRRLYNRILTEVTHEIKNVMYQNVTHQIHLILHVL